MDYIVPGIVTVVFMIGLFSVIGGTLNMRHEERKLKIKAEADAAAGAALNQGAYAEIASLKDRVRVLERLATDGDRNLAGEIERLRSDETRSGV